MAHTLPDYTTKYKMVRVFGAIDNAELAARLGAPSLLDRKGNIIWYDDFEAAAAAKWWTNMSAGGTIAVSVDRAWMGTQSMKTVTHTDAGDHAALAKTFCLPTERTMGAEFMFCMTTGLPIVRFWIAGYTGSAYFRAQVKYDHNARKLYYYDSADAEVELPLYDNTFLYYESWFYMKLVVDWDAQEYRRFIFCSTEYDLSGISMEARPNVTKKRVEAYLCNIAGTAAAATVYFDNFILTQNE